MAAAKEMVPSWVRNFICVIGAVSVPALILACILGANVGAWVAGAVTFNGLYVASLAFGRRDGRLFEIASHIFTDANRR